MKPGDYLQIPRNREVRFGGRWGTVEAVTSNAVVVRLNRTPLTSTGKVVHYVRAALEAAVRA